MQTIPAICYRKLMGTEFMKNTPFDRIASDCMAKKVEFPEQLSQRYMRILQKINDVWGTAGALSHLDELILPNRTDRQGFPPEVVSELVALKQLHEFVYPVRNPHVWDPYYHFNRERFKEFEDAKAAGTPSAAGKTAKKATEEKPRESVYKSWFATGGSRQLRNSPIGSLYPAKGNLDRTASPSTNLALNAKVEEILTDAEDMLGIRRINSAIGLYEHSIRIFSHYSAYPHLRLLELYYDLNQRDDFERVALRFSQDYALGPIRWVLIKEDFWTQLDRIAAALLQKKAS